MLQTSLVVFNDVMLAVMIFSYVSVSNFANSGLSSGLAACFRTMT